MEADNPNPKVFHGNPPGVMVATLGGMVPYVLDAAVGSTPTQVYYFHNDHLGTPQVITDESGQVVWKADYDPFGQANPVVQVIENNFRFPGQYYDQETGLHQNWFRDYAPALGRHVEADPIGLLGGMNMYPYVANLPGGLVDPLGLWMEKIWDNSAERAQHKDEAVTMTEFIHYTKGKSLHKLQNEAGLASSRRSARGPERQYRYVLNPSNPSEVIDMRHFLVVGPQGEYAGLMIEILQSLPVIGDPESAFDAQDFLSNALGAEFFETYNPARELDEQLTEFFFTKEKPCP